MPVGETGKKALKCLLSLLTDGHVFGEGRDVESLHQNQENESFGRLSSFQSLLTKDAESQSEA